ncbi:MAG: glycosyl transferase [Spirochaetes bacterium GWF1_31_7]|nr:MAG: glycosyl transferase [Spirochaetes bacterium GWE1_32_154]OHD46380.1 MAG: glycosyl transferase [Spirochaetes bacterium GWE2_31_10]OHD47757.1 MAG: glycosyl transferase [Spirochaetes bacterium GWF1_31_7]OHD82778.1 MAG: glycosyl transferase [Spirochaetes bacterium RIFOXYB1_FULL_32_8]HBD95608.1 glycosyl transferase [Spirochaetia bacterium]
MKMNAPIALFVYNRLTNTKETVNALSKNMLAKESDLTIFSDGPKADKDIEKVNEVRNYLKTITGFKSITIIESAVNKGLAASIISGVTEIVNKYTRIIVLEDDLVTSPYFLTYMNDALEMYENEEKVASIHGFIYPVKKELPETFFIKGADCWGWATWKRAWDLFESDGLKLLNELKNRKLTKEFNFNNSYSYTDMLERQIKGKNNSWAIRWYASAFLNDCYTLYPGKSLVANIGMNEGTHCVNGENFLDIYQEQIQLTKISPIQPDKKHIKIIESYFRQDDKPLYIRLLNRLKNILRPLYHFFK